MSEEHRDSARLIAALRDPRCYPHPVTRIELRETHISWVLLAGEFAYKIKKPVRLSFLDFSTLALRKFYCDEELRLNRRFAPSLYLGVTAITGSQDAPVVGGDGPAIEYAVKLKRFSPADELSSLVEARQVGCEELAAFGRTLAGLHANLPLGRQESATSLRDVVSANSSELLRLQPSQRERLTMLDAALMRLQEQCGSQLDARHRGGSLRECHGDLHSGNVVRLDGKLTPFDCIEFDVAFRNIDVLNDAAFLFMDLRARQRADLAYCFLNGWLEASGDYEALPLLPYYSTYRALVRAKVAALQNGQTSLRYIDTAERLLAQRAPRLLITCGLSGSGKSWLSRQLAPRMPAIHVRSDVERKRLAGLTALANSRSAPGSGIYTTEINAQTYARLLDCARAALLAGESIVVDAAFLRRHERAQFSALARELNAGLAIVHCDAPVAVLAARIRERAQQANDASEATADLLPRQQTYWESFTPEELPHVIEIDTARGAEAAFAALGIEVR